MPKHESDNQVRTRGVVAVLQHNDKLLMIKRAEGIPLGGRWCFPGGAILPDESSADALVREIREELGLTIEPGAAVWRWKRGDDGLDLQWWTARIVAGTVRPNPAEVQRAEWMTVETIRNTPDVLANNIEFIAFAEGAGLLPKA